MRHFFCRKTQLTLAVGWLSVTAATTVAAEFDFLSAQGPDAVVPEIYEDCIGWSPVESGFGADGRPRLARRLGLDRGGSQSTQERFLDAQGRPVVGTEGYAAWSLEYDGAGRERRRCYLGLDGQPTVDRRGIRELRFDYGPAGRLAVVTAIVPPPGGAKSGQVREIRRLLLYGGDGRLAGAVTLAPDGRSEEIEYGPDWQVTRQEFRGRDGTRFCGPAGYALMTAEYDRKGWLRQVRYYGTDGRATELKDGFSGLKLEFDADGKRRSEIFWGIGGDGREYVKNVVQYGGDGKITEFDRIERPRKGEERVPGRAVGRRTIFDARERIAAKVYLDCERRPCPGPGGYVREVLEYDPAGKVAKRHYFSRDGRSIPAADVESDLQKRAEQGKLPE